MLKEVNCLNYTIEHYGPIHRRIRMEISVTMTQEQLYEFFEHPLIYIKKSGTDNDFVCPTCGASLS